MSSTSQTRVAGTLLEFLVHSAFVLALSAQGANAASLNLTAVRLSESGAESSIVQRTHGCHYSCECGPLKDFGCEQCTTATYTCSAFRSVAGAKSVTSHRPKACAAT